MRAQIYKGRTQKHVENNYQAYIKENLILHIEQIIIHESLVVEPPVGSRANAREQAAKLFCSLNVSTLHATIIVDFLAQIAVFDCTFSL